MIWLLLPKQSHSFPETPKRPGALPFPRLLPKSAIQATSSSRCGLPKPAVVLLWNSLSTNAPLEPLRVLPLAQNVPLAVTVLLARLVRVPLRSVILFKCLPSVLKVKPPPFDTPSQHLFHAQAEASTVTWLWAPPVVTTTLEPSLVML